MSCKKLFFKGVEIHFVPNLEEYTDDVYVGTKEQFDVISGAKTPIDALHKLLTQERE